MSSQRFLLVLTAILSVVGVSAIVSAADWPQWGGTPSRNMVSVEERLPSSFEPGKKRPDGSGIDMATTRNVRWVAKLGTENYSSPVIADGRVFIGTNDASLDDPRFAPTEGGLLLCLDESTGRRLWQLVVPRLEIDRSKVSEDFDLMNLGICATPTVDGDRVYVVTNRCEVLCLDADGMADGNDGPYRDEATFSIPAGQPPVELKPDDADIVWQFDMLRELPVFPHDATNSAVAVYGNCVYVGTGNGVYDGKVVLPTAPSLIALDKHSGRLIAKDDGRISPRVFHGQWSSPSLVTVGGHALVLYGGGDGVCHAFKAVAGAPPENGLLVNVWALDANPPEYRTQDGRPIDYWAGDRRKGPANRNDGQYVGPSEIIGTPVVHANRVFVTIGQDPLHGRGRGALTCFDLNRANNDPDDACLWRYTNIERSLSTVAVADGLVYAADLSGKLHCVDAENGTVHWIHDTKQDIWSSPFVADGKVYLGTRKSLHVLAAGKQKQLLAEIRLGSPVWSVPAAANGVLYVASQRYLWAVEENDR